MTSTVDKQGCTDKLQAVFNIVIEDVEEEKPANAVAGLVKAEMKESGTTLGIDCNHLLG